ncbi:MAG: hypothetical protein JST01_10735 [Cyanobacteria bacterium SZAS TMP-1]|nr:hypothetical protein [Cyanobacteria bacterium SZAS TMP-1]
MPLKSFKRFSLAWSLSLCLITATTAIPATILPAQCQDPAANTTAIPTQILKTGINLTSDSMSPNSKQVANLIGLTPVLQKLQTLRAKVSQIRGATPTLENLALRQDYTEAQMEARQIIEQTNLQIEFVLAEIDAERNLYGEILSAMIARRDKAVARSNAASFYTNGVLWAVGEGLAIPTYKAPNYSIPSGTVSVLAGIVPSFFSLWAMHQYNGKKSRSENEPNMLAKLFGYPISPEVDYPETITAFLNAVPPDSPVAKSRKQQLIDRWVSDQNIPSFTNTRNVKLLDSITAAVSQKDGLSIDTLSARQDMLQQLAGEVRKMKRMLLELSMAVGGEKTLN